MLDVINGTNDDTVEEIAVMFKKLTCFTKGSFSSVSRSLSFTGIL